MNKRDLQAGRTQEGLILITVLLFLSAIIVPAVMRRGYHPLVGILVFAGLYALFFTYLQIQHYLDGRKARDLPRQESLRATRSERRGFTVLELDGRLDLDAAGILRKELARLLDAGSKFLLLNLAEVRFIGPLGLGVLVEFAVKARTAGGALKLIQPSAQVRGVLESSRVAEAIEIYADEGEAVASIPRQ